MEIKVKSIKLFCSIVETGSLIAAANKNLLSAPAASRVLSQLEDRLGFKLFHRTNRNLSLTEEGADFYRIAMES
ncbi:helix-turn-helix domain-containing protein, partial [Turicimonas muris]